MAMATYYQVSCTVCGDLGSFDDQSDAAATVQEHHTDPDYAGHQAAVHPAQYDDGTEDQDYGGGGAAASDAWGGADDDAAFLDDDSEGGYPKELPYHDDWSAAGEDHAVGVEGREH